MGLFVVFNDVISNSLTNEHQFGVAGKHREESMNFAI